MNKKIDARTAAAQCLAKVTNGASLSPQIPLFEARVNERDRALFRQLCYGVLRVYPKLDGIIKQLVKKPLKAKDADVRMLMMLGIYQLSDMRTPDHAAVNSTVAATKGLKKPWAKGLINGVLRQWQRQHDTLSQQLTPAETHAHPAWLYQAITEAWPEQAHTIMAQNNTHPPMCLRVNQQQVTRDLYLQQLTDNNIAANSCQHAPEGIRLQQPIAVEQLPGFPEGSVSVQDEAPQLCAALLDLKPKQRVLDACCAPGGKTCHILELEPALENLVALDIDESRLQRVTENLDRLALTATLQSGDAADTDSWWDRQLFDRILLDAPCSATGVIRRNPDIKLHRTPEDIAQLVKLQRKILDALWLTLKPQGLLLYATCSILPQENEQVIAAFCAQHENAEHLPIDAEWGAPQSHGRQLFPQAEGHDGFYYALLRRQ